MHCFEGKGLFALVERDPVEAGGGPVGLLLVPADNGGRLEPKRGGGKLQVNLRSLHLYILCPAMFLSGSKLHKIPIHITIKSLRIMAQNLEFDFGEEIILEGIKYKCDICKKQYKNKFSVTIHKNSVHKAEQFHCNLCGFKTSYKSSLTIHRTSKHKGIKFPCSKCNKQFTQKGNLGTHIQSVHNGKKYQCKYCKHQATQKVNLDTHVKFKHRTKQKYSCTDCDKQFTQKEHLRKHQQSVHNGKRYPCD